MTVPSAMLKAANRLVMPCRNIVVAAPLGVLGVIGSTRWERSSAWIWDFSSVHSTTAFSGGLWYSPTTSTTFSTKNGSADSLKESCRCGLRSNFFQIRPMVDLLSPECLAIEARDQCVSLPGADSSVATSTSST